MHIGTFDGLFKVGMLSYFRTRRYQNIVCIAVVKDLWPDASRKGTLIFQGARKIVRRAVVVVYENFGDLSIEVACRRENLRGTCHRHKRSRGTCGISCSSCSVEAGRQMLPFRPTVIRKVIDKLELSGEISEVKEKYGGVKSIHSESELYPGRVPSRSFENFILICSCL